MINIKRSAEETCRPKSGFLRNIKERNGEKESGERSYKSPVYHENQIGRQSSGVAFRQYFMKNAPLIRTANCVSLNNATSFSKIDCFKTSASMTRWSFTVSEIYDILRFFFFSLCTESVTRSISRFLLKTVYFRLYPLLRL